MSKEKDRIVKFTGEEIEINDNQKKPVNEDLLPPIDENIDALLFPARTIDTKICNLTVDINEKLAQIESLCGTAISCGCATTLTRSFVGYERIRIDRQDSEDRTHTGVNPFSVGIFGATSILTTGIGSDTVVNVGDLGRGIKTEKIISDMAKTAANIINELAAKKGLIVGIFIAFHTFGRDLKWNTHIHSKMDGW